ncbi:NmrA domain-containing protein [Favolaschia claudopus]|uniref:NmrA domain-containing protein n=1 Tax=Favolaschia claudopus TaxID=2862362 RepID=A0AAW0E576_9AGAR
MPIITIFGATGAQGGAVLEAVLADGKYTPRAVSRNVDSAASKALIAKGIEVVPGNLSDVESLKKAIQGSEAVFGVTNFWDPEVFPADPKGKLEITQGKNLVDAAKAVSVKFFIFSSLPNITKETDGKFTHVYHYDNKAIIEEYLKESGLPYASLLTCWFLDNLWKFGSLTKTDTGSYNIAIPKFEDTDVQDATFTKDIGLAAVGLLTHYKDASKGVVGGAFPVVSAQFTYPELAAAIGRALKKEVTFTSLPTGGMAEFDEMFTYQAKVRAYKDTPFPNPKLAALGVKFDSLEGFIQKEVVPRFA